MMSISSRVLLRCRAKLSITVSLPAPNGQPDVDSEDKLHYESRIDYRINEEKVSVRIRRRESQY